MSSIPTPETVVTNTSYGTVTNKRVTLHAKKWLFGGASEEDLQMRHITAVRVETVRHVIWAILFLIIGVAGLAVRGGGLILGIVFLALAALFVWGWPKVVVNTAGGDLRPAVGMPWTREEAETFVTALRQQLLNRE